MMIDSDQPVHPSVIRLHCPEENLDPYMTCLKDTFLRDMTDMGHVKRLGVFYLLGVFYHTLNAQI